MLLGKELCWDLANYHFYDPYAFLHHRANQDIWPSSFIHLYLNPVLDLLSYFLVNTVSPRMVEFFLGAVHGINGGLLFLIARFFVRSNKFALGIALLGLYGPTVFSGIGSFQNDNTVSLFVLGFILLQLHGIQRVSKIFVISAGTVLGIGAGLKLTVLIFFLGNAAAWFFLPRKFLQSHIIFSLAFVVGMMISSGYWMWELWLKFHNPFFPFFNQLFHSPYFPAVNWSISRFKPVGWMQTIFYPFYFSWNGQASDSLFLDFRFVVVYLLFLWAGIYVIAKRIQGTITLEERWLYAFFILSYIVWQTYFSIMRYAVVLEMLTPLMIYLLLRRLIPGLFLQWLVCFLIFSFLFISMVPAQRVRAPWYTHNFFDVTLPSMVKNTTQAVVFVPYPAFAESLEPRPQNYWIPFFPTQWHFVGLPFHGEKYQGIDILTQHKIETLIASTRGNFYLLTSKQYMANLTRVVGAFGLKNTLQCGEMRSDRQRISYDTVILCKATLKPTSSPTHLVDIR